MFNKLNSMKYFISLLFLTCLSLPVHSFEDSDAEEVANRIGYTFKNTDLLHQAFDHPSRFSGNSLHFQRLEKQGDEVLGSVVCDHIIDTYPKADEGVISSKIERLVSNKNNQKVFDSLALGDFLRHRSKKAGLNKIKSDTCEALIGAIYQDGGRDAAKEFILYHWWTPTVHVKVWDDSEKRSGLSGSFTGNTETAAKKRAACKLYRALTEEKISQKNAISVLEQYCQDNNMPPPEYNRCVLIKRKVTDRIQGYDVKLKKPC